MSAPIMTVRKEKDDDSWFSNTTWVLTADFDRMDSLTHEMMQTLGFKPDTSKKSVKKRVTWTRTLQKRGFVDKLKPWNWWTKEEDDSIQERIEQFAKVYNEEYNKKWILERLRKQESGVNKKDLAAASFLSGLLAMSAVYTAWRHMFPDKEKERLTNVNQALEGTVASLMEKIDQKGQKASQEEVKLNAHRTASLETSRNILSLMKPTQLSRAEGEVRDHSNQRGVSGETPAASLRARALQRG